MGQSEALLKEKLYWKKGSIERKALLKERVNWNKFQNLAKFQNLVQVLKFMLSSTVIGVELHRLGLKFNEVKFKFNEAKPSWTWTWPNWTWVELHEVIHHRLRSSPSRPSWSPTRRSRVGLQLGRDGLDWSCTRWTSVDSTQGHRVQVQVQRGAAELNLDLDEVALSWSCTRRRTSTSMPRNTYCPLSFSTPSYHWSNYQLFEAKDLFLQPTIVR